jgi:hypothetical protein
VVHTIIAKVALAIHFYFPFLAFGSNMALILVLTSFAVAIVENSGAENSKLQKTRLKIHSVLAKKISVFAENDLGAAGLIWG